MKDELNDVQITVVLNFLLKYAFLTNLLTN